MFLLIVGQPICIQFRSISHWLSTRLNALEMWQSCTKPKIWCSASCTVLVGEIVLPSNLICLIDSMSVLVQFMAWCHQVTSHNLKQFGQNLCCHMASPGHSELRWFWDRFTVLKWPMANSSSYKSLVLRIYLWCSGTEWEGGWGGLGREIARLLHSASL